MRRSIQSILFLNQGRYVFVWLGFRRHLSVGTIIHFGWRHVVRETTIHWRILRTQWNGKIIIDLFSAWQMFWLDSVPGLMLTHDSEIVDRLRRIVWRRGLRVSDATWTSTWYVEGAKRDIRMEKEDYVGGHKTQERVWLTGQVSNARWKWPTTQWSVNMNAVPQFVSGGYGGVRRGAAGFATAGRARGLHDARNGQAQRFATAVKRS